MLSLFFWHSISFSNRLIFFRWEKPNQKLSDESLKNERLTLDCFVYNTQHLKSWSISCCENNNQNFNGELLWVRAQQKKKSLACHKKFERDLSCSAAETAAAAAARYLNFVSYFLRANWRVDWSIATSVSSVVCANNCSSSSSNRFQSISNSCVHTTHTRVWLMRSNPPTLISTELFIPFFFPSNNNFKKVVSLFYREIYTRKVKRWRSFFLSSFWPAADPSNPSYLSWTQKFSR